MGNKLGRRRQIVDEKYTRPQGLYNHKEVDHKKLRKLILESKLAPCYPGDEESASDLEECPICFLVCHHPSLCLIRFFPVWLWWINVLLQSYSLTTRSLSLSWNGYLNLNIFFLFHHFLCSEFLC